MTTDNDTQTAIAKARIALEENWEKDGACSSCGWHASLREYDITDSDIEDAINENDGVLELPCLSDDEDGLMHRGVKIRICSGEGK